MLMVTKDHVLANVYLINYVIPNTVRELLAQATKLSMEILRAKRRAQDDVPTG